MTALKELLEKRAALDAEIEEARKRETAAAIATVRALVEQHHLTAQDIFGTKSKKAATSNKVPPKYRDPETGKTWSGRGPTPKWIGDKPREQFLIA